MIPRQEKNERSFQESHVFKPQITPPHEGTATEKREIRYRVKCERSCIPVPERDGKSRAIWRHLRPLLDAYDPILIYASKDHEVQTLGLISTLLSEGKRVIVPIIEQQTVSLRLSYLNDITTLVPSTFHVPEPVGREIPARPEEVQVAVIPMLAFDVLGNRIGYGAGYYDRFLKQCPWIKKIGIAFACQQAEHIPAQSDDIAMDSIVTEDGVRSCSR